MRILSLILLTPVFIASLTGPAAADERANPVQAAVYRIGFIVSLTGPLATFGEAIRNGVTLALEEEPAGRRVFEPIYEDSKYDSKTSVLNFQKLRSADRVSAVYVFGGPMSDTLSPLAERAGVPMFSTEYDVRYTRGKKYVVRFCNNAEDYAKALLAELRKRGYKRYSIVKVQNQYHDTLSDAFIESLAAGESAEIIQDFLPGEKDFRAVLPKIQGGKFDALGIYLSPGMQNAFFKQIRTLQLRPALFGTDTFESREENAGVELTVEGALFANSAVSDEFLTRYRRRFNSSTQIVHAALAYEFARLIADRFKDDSAAASPAEFMRRVALERGREGVCGKYFYRNTPETGQYFSFPLAVRSLRDGEAKILSVQPAP